MPYKLQAWLSLAGVLLIIVGCGLFDPRLIPVAVGIFLLIEAFTWRKRGP